MSKGRGAHSGASFATIEQHARRTRASNKSGSKKSVNAPNGEQSKREGTSEGGAAESSSSSKAERRKEKRKAKKAQRIKDNIAMTNCYKCGEKGHWARECPYDSDENKNDNVAMMTLGNS